jgi:hypothetical protein
MATENTGYLVEKIKNALMSNPNMNILVCHAMAKFVQNLYDLEVSHTKMIEVQRAVIKNLKKDNDDMCRTIDSLRGESLSTYLEKEELLKRVEELRKDVKTLEERNHRQAIMLLQKDGK